MQQENPSVSGDSLIIKGKWLTEKKIGQGAFGMK